MYCRHCRNEVQDTAHNCASCGNYPYDGEKHCQHCGEETNEGAVACPACGRQVKRGFFKRFIANCKRPPMQAIYLARVGIVMGFVSIGNVFFSVVLGICLCFVTCGLSLLGAVISMYITPVFAFAINAYIKFLLVPKCRRLIETGNEPKHLAQIVEKAANYAMIGMIASGVGFVLALALAAG